MVATQWYADTSNSGVSFELMSFVEIVCHFSESECWLLLCQVCIVWQVLYHQHLWQHLCSDFACDVIDKWFRKPLCCWARDEQRRWTELLYHPTDIHPEFNGVPVLLAACGAVWSLQRWMLLSVLGQLQPLVVQMSDGCGWHQWRGSFQCRFVCWQWSVLVCYCWQLQWHSPVFFSGLYSVFPSPAAAYLDDVVLS